MFDGFVSGNPDVPKVPQRQVGLHETLQTFWSKVVNQKVILALFFTLHVLQ